MSTRTASFDDHPITESQGYNSIGQLSPAAEKIDGERKGWQGVPAEPPADQQTAQDISFWNRRANIQAQATSDGDENYAADFFAPDNNGDIMANQYEIPYSARQLSFFPQADSGVITGADAAAETSGNSGLISQP